MEYDQHRAALNVFRTGQSNSENCEFIKELFTENCEYSATKLLIITQMDSCIEIMKPKRSMIQH